MSTQHPDNVNPPFFAENSEMGGEDEIKEAYYVFSHLGCDEQMWDSEGKEVDNFVVKKLLSKYENYFKEKILGKDVFITLRVPNPEIEKAESKILIETLESIPRSFDANKLFYNSEEPPIFEVILPMTSNSESLNRIYYYYKNFVVGKEKYCLYDGDIKVCEWIGEINPKEINVIPLFEDIEQMLNSHLILKEYLKDKKINYQRVFLARSDPALNYGLISAVLINKIALKKLFELSKELDIKIYPILGTGPSPFRGNLNPDRVKEVLNEYKGVYTFTIQSSFKYDHPPEKVRDAINEIKTSICSEPENIDEEKIFEVVKNYSNEYQKQLIELAPVINLISKYVPKRRKRKLHIGLFGYSREKFGVKLPRAIPFVCSMYSIGFPPEILGINSLTKDDIKFIRNFYKNFNLDLKDSLKFINFDSKYIPNKILRKLDELEIDFEFDKEHKEITDFIIDAIQKNKYEVISDLILKSALIRKFLG
ncbi:MAG: phosphoenolpyruvate carboxylase [Caldisericia bacterium]|nr:phosphoenolpyruvate carboxylase [Caldisericia bacterium]